MSSLIPLYDALVSIEVPSDRARAVVDALERDMTANLATRADLESKFSLLQREIVAGGERLDQRIDSLEARVDQKIDSLGERLGQKFETVEGRIKSVEGQVKSIEGQIASLDHGIKAQIGFSENRLTRMMDEKLKLQEKSMTVKLGGLLFLAMGLLFAALQLV